MMLQYVVDDKLVYTHPPKSQPEVQAPSHDASSVPRFGRRRTPRFAYSSPTDTSVMWLLNTRTRQLQEFARPPAEYTVLSHVWTVDEASFQRGAEIADNKVRSACQYVASDGYTWLWIDTCCIDKSNSTELSEAINSMFQWYSGAAICYAYLDDVPGISNSSTRPLFHRAFRRSKWHTRGWTLQELLAPREVMFLSKNWEPLGDKNFFAPILQEITGISVGVLTFQIPLSLVPAAEKMSWASSRKTTRLEDEAYSLLGIFDVRIPVIYGEGRHAFRRLQEEIMRTSQDHTLFTWGPSLSVATQDSDLSLASSPPSGVLHTSTDGNLLALSPAEFGYRQPLGDPTPITTCLYDIVELPEFYNSIRSLRIHLGQKSATSLNSSEDAHALPDFTVSSYGIRAYLPIIRVPERHLPVDSTRPNDDLLIAVLACRERDQRDSLLTGLVLSRPHISHMFEVGGRLPGAGGRQVRSIDITANFLRMLCRNASPDEVTCEWTTVYITQRARSSLSVQASAPRTLDVWSTAVAYALLPHTIDTSPNWTTYLSQSQGSDGSMLPVMTGHCLKGQHMTLCFDHWPSGKEDMYKHPKRHDGFRVQFGICNRFWATVEFLQTWGTSMRGQKSTFAEPAHNHHPGEGCVGLHVDLWDMGPCSPLYPGQDAAPDFYTCHRHRTFVHGDKKVRIRLTNIGKRRREPLWGITVDVDLEDWEVGTSYAASTQSTPSQDSQPRPGRFVKALVSKAGNVLHKQSSRAFEHAKLDDSNK